MWQATMLGGPEDGRTFTGPADHPPSELVIARPGPLTAEELSSSDPTATSTPFDQVVCRLERYDDGRWVYVWPTGTSS